MYDERIKLRKINTSNKYSTGTICPTLDCGDITILGQLDKYTLNKEGHRVYNYYRIAFSDGTKKDVCNVHLDHKNISNPNIPTLFGRGYLGIMDGRTMLNGKRTKEYELWSAIFKRCYSEVALKTHPSYRGCEIHPTWYSFPQFCADLPQLQNYTLWEQGGKEYQLDKDIKVKGNKIYSKDTCMFVTKTENIIQRNLTGKTFVGTRLSDGYTEEFVNMKLFAKTNNLYDTCIGRCASGKQGKHKGWTFKIKEEQEEKIVGDNK